MSSDVGERSGSYGGHKSRRDQMLKGGILWLMGVPLIVVILLVMFVF